jgi:hypothetical protein
LLGLVAEIGTSLTLLHLNSVTSHVAQGGRAGTFGTWRLQVKATYQRILWRTYAPVPYTKFPNPAARASKAGSVARRTQASYVSTFNATRFGMLNSTRLRGPNHCTADMAGGPTSVLVTANYIEYASVMLERLVMCRRSVREVLRAAAAAGGCVPPLLCRVPARSLAASRNG